MDGVGSMSLLLVGVPFLLPHPWEEAIPCFCTSQGIANLCRLSWWRWQAKTVCPVGRTSSKHGINVVGQGWSYDWLWWVKIPISGSWRQGPASAFWHSGCMYPPEMEGPNTENPDPFVLFWVRWLVTLGLHADAVQMAYETMAATKTRRIIRIHMFFLIQPYRTKMQCVVLV